MVEPQCELHHTVNKYFLDRGQDEGAARLNLLIT